MSAEAKAASKPFWAKCRKCDHCWPAAYYPMQMSKICKIIAAAICPKCGDRKPVVARQEDGELPEPAAAGAPA